MTNSIDDWRFDAAKTFARIERELECDPTDELEWQFIFSHPNGDHLEAIAETVGDSLATKLDVESDSIVCEFDDDPSAKDEDDDVVAGRPQLALIYIGSLTEKRLTSAHDLLRNLAQQHGIIYEGVRYV